jgi:hypothetical protein
MTLDEQLLSKARTQGVQAAEAERQAQLSRADYHTAVRRLHLAGGSLREIAEALGVSHQRVQQIVNDAGGSWWRRVWRTRIVKRDAVCTFCGLPPSEVAKLIAGPNVYICDACVTRAEKTLTGGANRGPVVLSRSVTARCAFCRKRRSAERPLIAQPAANICGDCLRLCRQILDDRAA